MTITTTTPKGTEGFNISYSQEMKVCDELKKILPDNWKVSIGWSQILFSDVAYNVDKKKKQVDIIYNQNLHIWKSELLDEIKQKTA